MSPTVAALYADGGVLGRNPSQTGGMYAWRHVAADGTVVREGSGLVLMPGDYTAATLMAQDVPFVYMPTKHTDGRPVEYVTNNATEFYAVLDALEALPDGWSGNVCSDSSITLGRLCRSYALRNIPRLWVERGARVRQRLGLLTPVLLQGHPTPDDLRRGVGAKRGYTVSEHNVWADRECNRLKALYWNYAPPSPRSKVHAQIALPDDQLQERYEIAPRA